MINEKSTSKTQQRLFGQAYGVKRWKQTKGKGGINPTDLNPKYKKEIVDIANSMSMAKLKDFAETKHKKLPEEVGEKSIKDIYYRLRPDAQYDPSREKERRLGNLADYREFIKKSKTNNMGTKKIDEDCGCGETTVTPSRQNNSFREIDPSVGKMASLSDGRNGKIDDSIRNSRGEVIGYVMNNEKGTFRVFKDKVTSIYEDGGAAMASLDSTPGMGEVQPPTRTSDGSGDVFPTLTAGTGAAKKGKKKESRELPKSILDWGTFQKNMKKNQN